MAKMLSRETLTVGILAILSGLIAAAGVHSYLAGLEEQPLPPPPVPPEMRNVPVAATDLPTDRVITKYDIITLRMTLERFKERYPKLDPSQVLNTLPSIVNRQLKEPVKRGEPFPATKFYLAGTGPSISQKLQPGFRAIRVQVPVTREASVRPGMFVDVYFRTKQKLAKPGQLAIPEKTLTLLKNIEVLDSDRPGSLGKASGRSKNFWYFTLAVPETKADFFSIIEDRGDLWLIPTPAGGDEPDDGSSMEVADIATLSELLGIALPRQPPPPFETVIYRRDHIQTNKFTVDGKLLTSQYSGRGTKAVDKTKTPATPAGDSPAMLPEEKE
jgi:pilus assembly protein CpaB